MESNESSEIKTKPEIVTNKEASVKAVSSPVASTPEASPAPATIRPFENKSASTGGTRLKIEEIDSSTGSLEVSSSSTEDTRVEEDVEKTTKEVGGSRTRGLGRRVEEELMASSSSSPSVAESERGIPALPLSFAQFTKDWRTLHTSSQRQEKKLSVTPSVVDP